MEHANAKFKKRMKYISYGLHCRQAICFTPKSLHLKSRTFGKLACTSVMHFSQILMSWPPKRVELCESPVKLPEELDAFLYTLLTGNTHIPAEYPDRLRALLILLARTSFYGVTPGLQKLLKQMLLPYAKQCSTYPDATPMWVWDRSFA